ncbi:hypothetical protein FA15DRAFT_590018 [Coprinopsis marcescibilis]|uniref:Zn(2)-C6 fungal-type domain-containing protein n=1 Tax=Coprinopsis marcescibilis TaxID=230819 RepID=A0A5C3KYK1_COPMA|nr:hypothetical protein FA15DRAFT_590018 [Coprinopsis marcescibilis]
MANKPYDKVGQSNALQRGKACLRCRKRKMKCDGAKPSCQQCTKAKSSENCEYDDGKGKTRTQLLKETIARLEERVKELEDPTTNATSIMLFDPHRDQASYSGSGSPCSFGSPNSAYLPAFPSTESSGSPSSASWSQLQSIPSPVNIPLLQDIFFDEQHSPFAPDDDISMILLDIFAPHSHQVGLEIDIDSLRSSLRRPMSEQHHACLMNSIYLWACFVSRPEALSQHEDYYLRKSLEAIPDALRQGQTTDVVRTSCILACYFLANGRILEGSYHASAAAALAEQIGLGRQSDRIESKGKYEMSSDRIQAFWQVYNLDRCWSVALEKTPFIKDGRTPSTIITCPWPQDASDYKMHSQILACNQGPTVQAFLAGSMSANGFSCAALRVKASALLSEADRLSAQWCPGAKISAQLIDEINNLERIVNLFLPTLVQPEQLGAVNPNEKFASIVAHTIAQTAMIYLHRPFAAENPISAEKCAQAARACISLISYINERDFVFLDPIVGPCWSCAADTTIGRLDRIEQAWPMGDSVEIINDLGVLLYALTKFDNHFPSVGK